MCKKTFLMLLCVLVGTGIARATDIDGDTADQAIRSDQTLQWVGQASERVGGAKTDGRDQCAVWVFELPTLQTGQEITSTNLSFYLEGYSYYTPQGNADLHGLDYSSSSSVQSSWWYQGAFDGDSSSTGIQDNILTGSTSTGTINTNSSGDEALEDYLNAQYTAGASGGDYVFIRLNADSNETNSPQRYWNIAMANHSTSSHRPLLTVTIGSGDSTAPSPDPATFATDPYATGATSISMTATTATDASGVEYYFDATDGGNDSGWQDSASYEDTGLSELTQYTYKVQSRDKSASQNATGWSTTKSATTDDDTAPSPDPMTWAAEPSAASTSSITMTATTATDVSGFEYYFDCTAGGGSDSGWQDSASYSDTGLDANSTYTYKVQARDKSSNQNATGWSTTKSATTQAEPPGPSPVGWWRLDETSGTTAEDYANGYDGTVTGAEWTIAGYNGGALSLDGTSGHRCQIPSSALSTSEGTISMWAYLSTGQTDIRYFFGHTSSSSAWADRIQLYMDNSDLQLDLGLGDTHKLDLNVMALSIETWYHIVLTWNGSDYVVYVDGAEKVSGTYSGLSQLNSTVADIGNNGCIDNRTQTFQGVIDDVRIYDVNLTAGEVSSLFSGTAVSMATAPNPSHGATDIAINATLSWTAGDNAASHDVYFGTDYNSVADANHSSSEYMGNYATASYDPNGLSYDTTYHWAVDEVNGTDVALGDMWSFSTLPAPDTTAPSPDPMTWSSDPAATGTTSISMTATTATDSSGVQYYFDCTSSNGNDSGWQSGSTYEDTGLIQGTLYSYRVKARDTSSNYNETLYSTVKSATTETGGGVSFSDDFNRSDRDLDGDNGWTAVLNGTAEAEIESNEGRVRRQDDTEVNPVVGGKSYIHRSIDGLKLTNNNGVISWGINVNVRMDPAVHNWAFVLGATGSNLNSGTTKGYLVTSNANNNDRAMLASFDTTSGLGDLDPGNAYITAVINSDSDDHRFFYSDGTIRVDYNPSNNNWSLYASTDVVDPNTLDSGDLVDTVSNTAHTSETLSYMGVYFQFTDFEADRDRYIEFDNLSVGGIDEGEPGNASPVANAGTNQIVNDSDDDGNEVVALNGSGSYDPDGSISSYSWKEGGNEIATGVDPNVTFDVGEHVVSLLVTDNEGANDLDVTVITVTAYTPEPNEPNTGAVTSSTTWQSFGFASQNGTFSVDFNTIPNQNFMNGVTGISDGPADAYPDMACIVRFNPDGYIDARNGGNYDFDANVPYTAGTKYHVTMDINVPAHTYSVDVTPDGGSKVDLAADFSFRTEQSGATSLDNWALYAVDGSHSVGNIIIETGTVVNQDPVANAGSDQTVIDTDENGSESVNLDGTASYDPDGSISSYVWKEGVTQIATGSGPSPTLTVGVHNIVLTVTDNNSATATDTVVITVNSGGNQSPVANAGSDQTVVDSDENGSEVVSLDGSGSSDSDGTISSYVWKEGGNQIATGSQPSVTLALGLHTITLTVTDNDSASSSDTVVVEVKTGSLPIPYTRQSIIDGAGLSNPGILTSDSGTITITTDDYVYENKDLSGKIIIDADNVTIRNCKVSGDTGNNTCLIFNTTDTVGTTIEYCELYSPGNSTNAIIGEWADYVTVRYCEIYGDNVDGAKAENNSLYEFNYIHLYCDPADPKHLDGIQGTGRGNWTARYNVIELPWHSASINACVYSQINPNNPVNDSNKNVHILYNYLKGASYTVRVYQGTGSKCNYNVFTEGAFMWGYIHIFAEYTECIGNVFWDGSPVPVTWR